MWGEKRTHLYHWWKCKLIQLLIIAEGIDVPSKTKILELLYYALHSFMIAESRYLKKRNSLRKEQFSGSVHYSIVILYSTANIHLWVIIRHVCLYCSGSFSWFFLLLPNFSSRFLVSLFVAAEWLCKCITFCSSSPL